MRRIGAGFRAAVLAGLVGALAAGHVEAKPGGGRASMGSRGSATHTAPPSTATAPSSAQPMQRTETPRMAPQPGFSPSAAPAQPRRFGFGTGLAAGLLGAGLFGMLTGNGFFGGIAGLASVFGLLFQVALIVGLVWLALRLFRRREPALAGAGAPMARSSLANAGPMFGGGGGQSPPARQPLSISPQDYQAFERTLGEVQTAYGREDMATLRRLCTPEMARYLEEELSQYRADGVRNEVTDPRLLQGDLAEAWREGTTDYATVAMRFSVVDVTVDRNSGRVVQGDRSRPTEATEIWTFRRDGQGPWALSAIQQTG